MSKKISLPIAVVIMIALVLTTFMATYTLTSVHYRMRMTEAYLEGIDAASGNEQFSKLAKVMELFHTNSICEWDEEAAWDAMLQAYAIATNDAYADYYNAEEFRALSADNHAEAEGIGISIIDNAEEGAIEIILVYPDSPAEEAGLCVGDLIVAAGIGDAQKSIASLGYYAAVAELQGKAGTKAEFVVNRNGELLEFSVERRAVTAVSVMHHVCETDPSVGIIKMTGFDTQTPVQFDAAMDDLIARGCNSFVFDVRYNPGGDLLSIKAVLARFLNEGDVVIRTVYKDNQETSAKIAPYTATSAGYEGCNIKKEDIGKYRGYPMAVLASGSTASAAELFTACLKDYQLATVVGKTTFGKGIMQSIIPLANYGYEGGVRMTVAYYNSPLSDNYQDIGITPDIDVDLDPALANKNVYKITDAEDNQLQRAIEAIRSQNP
jgi:carboxyl-terminal processing protease